jgi:hypothetical protein
MTVSFFRRGSVSAAVEPPFRDELLGAQRLDGATVGHLAIPLINDGHVHHVRVVMGGV